MSDVERICHVNHERVRWAEEYKDVEVKELPEPKRDASMNRYRCYKAATVLSASLGGIGITFLCIGVAMMHIPTILMGTALTIVFMACGYCFDVEADKELDNVL